MEELTLDNLVHGSFPLHTNSVTVLASEGSLSRGAVLGKITKGAITIAAGSNTGNGAAATISIGSKAIVGSYTLKCITAATTFKVIDPDGNRLDDLTVGTAYGNGHFTVTISAGTTAFAVGDTFTVTVAAGSGKYRLVNSSNTDGTQVAEAILASDISVGTSDEGNVPVYETGDFNSNELSFGGSDTYSTHKDALRLKGIFIGTSKEQ